MPIPPAAPAPIERILFPTDFSSFSADALRHALALAQRFKAELKVVHVVPPVFPSGDVEGFAPPMAMTPPSRSSVEDALRRFLASAREARIDHRIEVRDGEPWREIVEAAEEMPADLVVMGTHGRGGLERLLLGSVAEKLVHRLPCPALTVCHDEGRTWQAPGLLTRILCATDFSDASAHVFPAALAFAQGRDVRLTLVHVIEDIPDYGRFAYAPAPDFGPFREDVERAARERLQLLADGAPTGSVIVETRVAFGRAHREILRLAAEERADLVVIGAQGHGMIEHMLSGSNAQHVIRGATCPVLTVRPLKARIRQEDKPMGLVLSPSAAPPA